MLAIRVDAVANHVETENFARQALEITVAIQDRNMGVYAWQYLGAALHGQCRWREAVAAYDAAIAARSTLGQAGKLMGPLAGQALAYQADDQLEQALAKIEQILVYLDEHPMDYTDSPIWVHLACYHVLKSVDDVRAGTQLDIAHTLLQERAAKIGDETLRQCFLEQVPENRAVMAAWWTAQMTGD